jgi:UDP-glucose 4-epimerase
MSLLITGGTGDIGSHLTRAAIDHGQDVVAFDMFPRISIIGELVGKAAIVKGNVLNLSELMDCMRQHKVNRVAHLAAFLGRDVDMRPFEGLQVNVMGIATVLEACRATGVKKVVYCSTSSVYEPSSRETLVDESYIKNPRNLYGVSKLAAELYGQLYARKFGFEWAAIRLKRLFMPGQREDTGVMGVIGECVRRVAQGKTGRLPYKPEEGTHLTYVHDVVGALFSALYKEKLPHSAYNVESGWYSMKDFSDAIRKVIPAAKIDIGPVEGAEPIPPFGKYDISLAERELGYKPSFTLEQMMREVIEYNRNKK